MENSISFNGEDTIQSGIFHLGFYKDFKQVWILVKPEKDLFCSVPTWILLRVFCSIQTLVRTMFCEVKQGLISFTFQTARI